MRTLTGLVVKAKATSYRLFEYAGGEWNGNEIEQKAFAEELYEFAQKIDRPAPLVEAPLADLIEAHKQAHERFVESIDADPEAHSAWNKEFAKNPVTTPVRIRDGKVVVSHEVTGEYEEEDLQEIEKAHDQWLAELQVRKIEQLPPAAAEALRVHVEASRAECLRRYREETTKELAERRGPYQPAREAYEAASDAEKETLDTLLRYQPRRLSEVKSIGAYLLTTDEFGELCAGAEVATLLRTLAAIES